MSRTFTHKPFDVAFCPEYIVMGPRTNATPNLTVERRLVIDGVDWYKANKHFPRSAVHADEVRRSKRRARYDARTALKAERWDVLPLRSGRTDLHMWLW
jgi:hypothetical protein